MEILKGYEKPQLTDLGTLADLTEGQTAVVADDSTLGMMTGS